MKVYSYLLNRIEEKKAAYLILIDPDKLSEEQLLEFIKICDNSDVDGYLVGGSLITAGDLEKTIDNIKSVSKLPTILFPGSVNQVNGKADALFYLSLLSGRNPEHLIGNHVNAAPLIKKVGIETISVGYLLIESGKTTTAEYMSGTKPIPAHKPQIAAATALAGEYLGVKMIYLEAGSGADNPVPVEMVSIVSKVISIPIIVGGGIKTPQQAEERVRAGAKIIVTGNYFENSSNWDKVKEFSKAIRIKKSFLV